MAKAANAVAVQDREAISRAAIVELKQGRSLRDIATKIGCAHTTLRVWVMMYAGREYADLIAEAHIMRIAEADEKLDDAKSSLEVMKAKEVAKFARWDAERRLPHLFATRQEITGANGGPVELTTFERAQKFAFLKRAAAELEGTATVVAESSPEPVSEKRNLVGGPALRGPFGS